jgi:hypothetical protein
MAIHVPLIRSCFHASNHSIPVVVEAGINSLRVEKIREIDEAGLATWPVDVKAVFNSIANREKNLLILELKVTPKAPIKSFTQYSALGIVIHSFRMQEPLKPLY